MRRRFRWLLTAVSVVGLAALGLPTGPAVATHNADLHSPNLSLVKTLPKTGVTNSDLAFWGNRAYAGYLGATVGGFRIIDITNPANATVITDFSCPGSQNDISVWNNDNDPAPDLLFLSVDTPRTGTGCTGTTPSRIGPPMGTFATAPDEFEGVRIFDINNETAPVQLAAVPTDCGSHTHTLVPGKGANAGNLYIYVSSYPLGVAAVTTDLGDRTATVDGVTIDFPDGVRNNGTECLEPEPDPGLAKQNGYHDKISIITVPLANPAAAANRTPNDPDGAGGNDPIGWTYPNVKEFPMEGSTVGVSRLSPTRAFDFAACHDIAVFVELDLASASCWAEAQLWDISDPLTPDFLRRVRNPVMVDTLFHSTTFTWDGKTMALEDEAGGGGDDRCRSVNDPQGRILFYDTDANLQGTFKIPRPQPKSEICTAHNYNYVPQSNGRHILVSAWYEGGTSVIDATNPAAATEIAFYDAQTPVPGGTAALKSEVWSSYWYNGFIYANDIRRGLDIFQLNDPRVEGAISLARLNPQTQESTIPQVLPRCRGRTVTMFGTSGADTLIGTPFADVIAGLGGNDVLRGRGGNDRICGGDGRDRIVGGAGADRLSGNRGADRIAGGPGGDNIHGGPGRDRCNGGPSADRIRGCEVIVGSR